MTGKKDYKKLEKKINEIQTDMFILIGIAIALIIITTVFTASRIEEIQNQLQLETPQPECRNETTLYEFVSDTGYGIYHVWRPKETYSNKQVDNEPFQFEDRWFKFQTKEVCE